jgi:Flp pilus assembly pilin Flp
MVHPLVVRLWRDESGLTAFEYSLVAVLVMIGIVVSVTVMGTFARAPFNSVATAINNTP